MDRYLDRDPCDFGLLTSVIEGRCACLPVYYN
jgi:hypothetical protein